MSVLRACIVLCLCFGLPGCQHQRPSAKLNVILIVADDLGYGDLGCYGNQVIQTPHLDALAAQGIRFTDFHANGPVCTPTRAALLTGKYQQRSGLEGVLYVKGETRSAGLDPSVTTLADLMQREGYATGIMGKWHLGYEPAYSPVQHGFDEFYGYLSGNIDYISHYDGAAIYDWWHNLDTLAETGYVTDLITRHAVDFIRRHQREPFFLYVAHEAPHAPYQGRNDPGLRAPGKSFPYAGNVADKAAAYKEMVEVLDEGIGEIMRTVRALALAENTLVLFLSDNGAVPAYGNNGILNGHKGSLFEGGQRVPAIAWREGNILPRVSDATLMSFDIMPTVLAACNIRVPDDLALDGIDIAPVFAGADHLPDRDLFWRYREQRAVRRGNWKLLLTKKDTLLFNLEADPTEDANVLGDYRALADTLHKSLAQWEAEIERGAPVNKRDVRKF